MQVTINLDLNDIIEIARLVRDTPHYINKEYCIRYNSNSLTLLVWVFEDSEFGFCVSKVNVIPISVHNDNKITIEVNSDITTQIENALRY